MRALRVLCLLSPGLPAARADAPAGPVVATAAGKVRGVKAAAHTDAFWGIPYAQPPIGLRRWEPPRAARPWNGTRDATKPGPKCIQMGTPMFGSPAVDYDQVTAYMGVAATDPGNVAQSEDCLTLNVFAPAVANSSAGHRCAPPACNVCAECCHAWIAPGADCEACFSASCAPNGTAPAPQARPVLLWVHGGAYENGYGADSLYNGTAVIEAAVEAAGAEPPVVVTVNYRLNVFGFLGSAELANASADGATGNFGLQDQRLAMHWIRANIAAFGGDPARVLLFGESAGAGSVAAHTVMPRSVGAGLFHRAILESGGYSVWDAHGLRTAQKTFDELAGLLCPAAAAGPLLDCLREKDTATVAIMAQLLPKPCNPEFCCKWAPVVDGVELTAHPYQLVQTAGRARVPVLLGSNRDEDQSFIGQELFYNLSADGFASWASDLYNFSDLQQKEFAALYPAAAFPRTYEYSPHWWAAIRAASDQDMVCPARRGARRFAGPGGPDPEDPEASRGAWLYSFTRPRNGSEVVQHGAELEYVWRQLSALRPPTGTPADEALSSALLQYWLNFAQAGDPNGARPALAGELGDPAGAAALPYWPRFEDGLPRGDVTMKLDVGEGLLPELERAAAECAWWDGNDPCFLRLNASVAEQRRAQRHGCGNL
jgi:para-nitrobenzyl esterase